MQPRLTGASQTKSSCGFVRRADQMSVPPQPPGRSLPKKISRPSFENAIALSSPTLLSASTLRGGPHASCSERRWIAWLRRVVEGNPKPLETCVFSNELDEPYRLFHRMWQSIAEGTWPHADVNPRLNYQGLSDESQETFRRINLRWHDLRHEYASRALAGARHRRLSPVLADYAAISHSVGIG